MPDEEDLTAPAKISLAQFVSEVLDKHLEELNMADAPIYGVFWRGQMLRMSSGKFAFRNKGAAKTAIYNSFYAQETAYAHSANPDRKTMYGLDCSNVESTEYFRENKKRFRETLLKHLDIKVIERAN